MAKHEDMMILPVEKRRAYFRQAYALELARLHKTGVCRWPIERLSRIVDMAFAGLASKKAPQGNAFAATKKFFGLRSNRATFEFLGY